MSNAAKQKAKHPRLNLPAGTARYPHLNKPDTKFNPDGEFKTDIVYDSFSEIEPVVRQLEAYLRDFAELEGVAEENILPAFTELNDGRFVLRCKQKAFKVKDAMILPRPVFFDARGKRIADSELPQIRSGARIAVAVEAWAYPGQDTVRVNNKRINVKTCGVTLKPKAVQLIHLGDGAELDASGYGFGVHEAGYEADSFNDSYESYGDYSDSGAATATELNSSKDF